MVEKTGKEEFQPVSILYVIRHAQASFGQKNYDRLSDAGLRQAKVLADHFLSFGPGFDAIYMGRQVRHQETLAPLLEGLSRHRQPHPPLFRDEAFNEYDSETIIKTLIPEFIKEDPAFTADAAGMFADRRAFQKVYETIMGRWICSKAPIPGLESWRDYSGRVISGIETAMADAGSGKTIALFTSGGPIAICVQKALGLSNTATLAITWQIMNASVTRFKFSGNRLMLFGFNDVGHLERTKDRQLITYR